MKENMELERKDLVIDRDMEVDCDIGQQITCYIETWFDVDEKFRIKTNADEGTWLNMYGKYNPFADTLRIECVISGDDFSDEFDYQPTAAESQLIKDMITERIREIATIKVLGFYRKETASYVFREIYILAGLGSIVGVFLGKALHAFVMAQVQIDAVYFPCIILPMSYLYAVGLTLGFTVLIAMVMRGRLHKIDMAESLKSVE